MTRCFLAIKQEGSYTEYRKQFEHYSAPIPEISELLLEGAFIHSLDPKLKVKVESQESGGAGGGDERSSGH